MNRFAFRKDAFTLEVFEFVSKSHLVVHHGIAADTSQRGLAGTDGLLSCGCALKGARSAALQNAFADSHARPRIVIYQSPSRTDVALWSAALRAALFGALPANSRSFSETGCDYVPPVIMEAGMGRTSQKRRERFFISRFPVLPGHFDSGSKFAGRMRVIV
jgi:hypothetical protein